MCASSATAPTYLYVLPALGVMALVIAYPVYYTVYLSFFNTPPNLALEDKIFVGLANYGRILAAESFHEATWNTLVWTIFSTFFAFVLGFGAAIDARPRAVRAQRAAGHAARALRDQRGRGVLTSGAGSTTAISASSGQCWWRSA